MAQRVAGSHGGHARTRRHPRELLAPSLEPVRLDAQVAIVEPPRHTTQKRAAQGGDGGDAPDGRRQSWRRTSVDKRLRLVSLLESALVRRCPAGHRLSR